MHFYNSHADEAIQDFSNDLKNLDDDNRRYASIWLHIVRSRLRQNDESEFADHRAQLTSTNWSGQLLDLFAGKTQAASLLDSINNRSDPVQSQHFCEANFYSGELALLQNDNKSAADFFRIAVASCPPWSSMEQSAAKVELRLLGI